MSHGREPTASNTMFEINTTADWMQALAEAALGEGEFDLDRLQAITEGWLQTQDEMNAQLALLGAVRELMDEAGRY